MYRKVLASAICAALFIAGAAQANETAAAAQQTQDQSSNQSSTNQSDQKKNEDQQSADETKPQELEAVTVTGSLLARPEYQTLVPIQVVNLEADVATGKFGTAAMLQSTAVAAGSTQINNQFSGFIVGGGTGIQTIDLRGLGATRTLVLLDGQRPGPAGVRGQTGSGFDLNVVPQVILARAEVVKSGASSIYGSDAIAGVVNLITRKRMEDTELTVGVYAPEHGGGEQYTASIGTGWGFDNGNIMVAAQVQQQSPLAAGDRDFLACPEDIVWGANEQGIDREDRSIIGGTPLGGCDNLYANTILRYADGYRTRYVPSVDGSTVGPFPGYHPRHSGRYDDGDGEPAYYEDVLNYPFSDETWYINKNRNYSAYASSLFTFGSVNWTNQFLYNHRQTETNGFRQFFPIVSYGPFESLNDLYTPIMPFPSKSKIEVDYYYLRSQLAGGFGMSSWSWQANATYSHSDGDYSHLGIDATKSGDLGNGANQVAPGTTPEYFTPGYLSGEDMAQLIDQVGHYYHGNTVYDQTTVNGLVSGNLFTLPAGDVSAAFGAEYRHYKINDQPDPLTINNQEWGRTSADVTKGSDYVTEVFGEVGIPLLKGLPAVESLTADVSARAFEYNTVGESANVWKYGLNWQITPTWRVRGTVGTSYRAPALYELYLGNLKGFLPQFQIDPCIRYEESLNTFIKANCAAAGIPPDFNGAGSSAEFFQKGGLGKLDPERSKAKSLGVVWTPDFANFNVAVDYFDYHIRGEITTLGADDILFGCYASPVYPNHFCDLFHRNPGDDPAEPFKITDIHATYININSERSRGYDVQLNYSNDFSFGTLRADAAVTYTIEDSLKLFVSADAGGATTTNFVGYIGRPKTAGIAHVSLERGDWTYYWRGDYVSTTSNKDLDGTFTYFGYENAHRDITAGWQFRHSVSAKYKSGKWSVLFGIRNLFDKAPDIVSAGVTGRRGNIPIGASQYDWFGRTYFARLNYNF